jgi:hypothetical protein
VPLLQYLTLPLNASAWLKQISIRLVEDNLWRSSSLTPSLRKGNAPLIRSMASMVVYLLILIFFFPTFKFWVWAVEVLWDNTTEDLEPCKMGEVAL